jgi:hypothetical protein
MRDVGGVIRKAIFQALDGNITYNSAEVVIFDEAPTEGPSSQYILLSTQTENDARNNARFVHEGTILLDIVTVTGAYVTKEIAESISDQILDILLPTIGTTGITLDAGFNLTDLRRESANYLPMLQTDTAKILRKVLRLSFRIQES